MTKRAVHSVRPVTSVVALCLVLLQLVSALHFALIPHGFGAGLRGFVHLHRASAEGPKRALGSAATRLSSDRPSLVADIAECAPEACPVGFAGSPSRPVSPSQLCALLCLPAVSEPVWRDRIVCDRAHALLRAPKTSPPRRAV